MCIMRLLYTVQCTVSTVYTECDTGRIRHVQYLQYTELDTGRIRLLYTVQYLYRIGYWQNKTTVHCTVSIQNVILAE